MRMGRLMPWTAAALLACCGCSDPSSPVLPNRPPRIASLTAWPTAIAAGDSTLVTCIATDEDGDSLVYDWASDCRLAIKGNAPDDYWLFGSPSNSHIFYRGCTTSLDSAWVECTVRDRRGGNDVRMITVDLN